MKLNPADFNAFLSGTGGIGQDMLWRRSSTCPCVNPHSGAANPKCPHCNGKGVTWASPVRARAGVANQSVMKEWAKFGQYESGDAVVSVPEASPMYEAGRFDRVTMLNGTDRFSLVLTRGMNDRIHLPVKAFQRVFWYVNNLPVEGKLPKIDAAGNLRWDNGGEPPPGVQYSVTGVRFTEFYVYGNLPSDRNQHYGARLPIKLVLRRFDLFNR